MELELIDYIDADEGRDFPPAIEVPECDYCGEECNSLVYQEDFKIFVCPDCLRKCEEQIEAEEWAQECTCRRVDVDYYDVRGCCVHDRRAA